MDLACVGRSSLAAVLPVLAACGVQGCPLPTTLFSSHTGGFGEVEMMNAAAFCESALVHYAREGVEFDAIYTGYLLGKTQFTLARHAMRAFPRALKIVDPSLGDNGRRYTKITPEMVGWMKDLCTMADILTPNHTESALLLGETPGMDVPDEETLQRRLAALASDKRQVLITSVPQPTGMATFGCGPNGKNSYSIAGHYVPQSYPGTGDLYAAALCGLVLRGHPVPKAAAKAAGFVEAAVRATFEGKGEVRHGVWFEGQLPMLATLAAKA